MGVGDGALDMILRDPQVGTAAVNLWKKYLAAADQVFDEQFRTPDFEQRVLEEIDKHLAAGRSFADAVRQTAVRTQNVVLGILPDKSVAGSAGFAAARAAKAHPRAREATWA